VFIAIESEPPYEVAVYRLMEAAIEYGELEIRNLLLEIAKCQKTGIWPGYADEVQDIALPPWAWSKIEGDKYYE
ncbi:MAG: hypothetical protein AABY22_11045, partial [Nanoarchaeota archaeon]